MTRSTGLGLCVERRDREMHIQGEEVGKKMKVQRLRSLTLDRGLGWLRPAPDTYPRNPVGSWVQQDDRSPRLLLPGWGHP